MSTVYVLNKDGKPLMPTTRCGHVRYPTCSNSCRKQRQKTNNIPREKIAY